jgi:hypothetical protein
MKEIFYVEYYYSNALIAEIFCTTTDRRLLDVLMSKYGFSCDVIDIDGKITHRARIKNVFADCDDWEKVKEETRNFLDNMVNKINVIFFNYMPEPAPEKYEYSILDFYEE